VKRSLGLLLLLIFSPHAAEMADGVVPQQLRIIKQTGVCEFRPAKSGEWRGVDTRTPLAAGYSLQTEKGAALQLSFEPAITAQVHENSLVNLEHLLIDRAKKTIRMELRVNSGRIDISMPARLGYHLLFTLATPYATVHLNNADVSVVSSGEDVQIEVLRESAKITHDIANLTSVVYAPCRAVVNPKSSAIQITGLKPGEAAGQVPRRSGLKVAILSVQSEMDSGVDLESVSDYVAQEIEKRSSVDVLFYEDVRAILSKEGNAGLLGCYEDSCISQIGSRLGVDFVVLGKLGQVGQRYLFNLKMIDALRGKTITRVNTTVENRVDNILDEIPEMIGTIVQKSATAESEMAAEAAPREAVNSPDSLYGMVWLNDGAFDMGSRLNAGDVDESPQHKVALHGFYIDKCEVTRGQFEKAMGYNPSAFKGCSSCPVDNVTWQEAAEYCRKVNKRLPTEAEWEYACRAGAGTDFANGSAISGDNANFDGSKPFGGAPAGPYKAKALPVGSYSPNGWGLYDMHGNVGEWCSDWYDPAYYGNATEKDPSGPSSGKFKVVRGGAWNSDGASLRCANRNSLNPDVKLNSIGFRCVKDYLAQPAAPSSPSPAFPSDSTKTPR
jgi:formylglycine-generating enzyme required for sulfatase activity